MFIIFGWGRQTVKKHGPVLKYHCENCRNDEFWQLYTKRTWFTLFFIPVIPYSSEHLLLCPICNYGVKLAKEKFNELRAIAECNMELIDKKITEEEHSGRIKELTSGQTRDDGTPVESSSGRKTETQLNYIRQMQEIQREKEARSNDQSTAES